MDIKCFICLSKSSEITIPVKLNHNFKLACDCGETMTNNIIFCKTCIEDWLEPFNHKTGNPSHFVSTGKCLLCRKILKNNFKLDDIYNIDIDLINSLDNINNNVHCPRCNLQIQGRLNLNNHLINECPKNIIECHNCFLYYNYNSQKKHIRSDKKCVNNIKKFCSICNNNVSLFDFYNHKDNCNEQLLQCTMCDDVFKKLNLKEHICDYNKLKKKVLTLKEINKNLVGFSQDKIIQFKFQVLKLQDFLKDDVFQIPSIDEINTHIEYIFSYSKSLIDCHIDNNSEYINIQRYNKFSN
jgi:uncharacterized C2H2 Zn-finger protein